MENIAQMLKSKREEAGVDIEEAGKDLNINHLFLHNLEEGKIGAFKDIFVLKEYLINYSKYLGLDSDEIIDEFNEYLFEYTSKIPVKEIEDKIANMETEEEKVISPYSFDLEKRKKIKYIYIMIYILIIILVIFAIFWSYTKISKNENVNYVISYRK